MNKKGQTDFLKYLIKFSNGKIKELKNIIKDHEKNIEDFSDKITKIENQI